MTFDLAVAKKRSKREIRVLGGTGSSSLKRVTDFPNLYSLPAVGRGGRLYLELFSYLVSQHYYKSHLR